MDLNQISSKSKPLFPINHMVF